MLAHRDGAGEGHLAYGAAGHHGDGGLVRRLRQHHVDHAGGRAAARHQVDDVQGGQRGLRSGLQHDSATRGQCGGDFAGRHGRGEVPRRDEQAHAHRLGQHHDALVAGGGLADLAGDTHCFLAEPAEELRRIGHLAAGLGDGLAVLELQQRGDLGLLGHHRLEAAAQDLGPLPRRCGRPAAPGARRGVHGVAAVVGRGGRNAGDHLAGGRVVDVQRAVGSSPVAVDEQSLESVERIDHGRSLPVRACSRRQRYCQTVSGAAHLAAGARGSSGRPAPASRTANASSAGVTYSSSAGEGD